MATKRNSLFWFMAAGEYLQSDFSPAGYGSPTMARPGSEEKIEVLIRRMESGLHLFHPDDAVVLDTGRDEDLSPR